ncbi:MAG TPA: NUDIX hydrolase [Thermoanaerobaculia bacterium]|nr:NUDIX hydrolase [Thermoanaerobaculia bacterium]
MTDQVDIIGDKVLYSGRLLDIASRTLRVEKNGEVTEYSIEVARRPPGVRLIVNRGTKYLLLREFRSELAGWDYRLAGGKVFESQAEHLAFKSSGKDLSERLLRAVSAEAKEELGILVKTATLLRKSSAGATIDWDLYFFRVDTFDELKSGPQPEQTELLTVEWHDPLSVLRLIENGSFSEDRSIGVLMQEMLARGELSAASTRNAPK